MKKIFRILAVVVLSMGVSTGYLWAGNDTRRGTAGAPELLMNPWARSSGWGGVNIANVRGLESFYNNVAGLAFIPKMEVSYSNTSWLGGKTGLLSGATINAFGLGVRVFDAGVLGVYVMATSFGDIPVVTETNPEPGSQGTFAPTYMNINVAYAHSFTRSIHGGVNIKIINETTENVTASGFAVDAGIQYVTGEEDQLKFGVSLKNWGPSFGFEGTGLSFTTPNEAGNDMTVEFRTANVELPTNLNIGASYDFLLPSADQRITLAASFTSNAFLKDNITVGLEYSIFDMVQLRAAYVYQSNIFSESNRSTVYPGLNAGASFIIPINKESGQTISIDYSYKDAFPTRGTHALGASFRF